MSIKKSLLFFEFVVVADIAFDNVALAKKVIHPSTTLYHDQFRIILNELILPGERFALRDILPGEYLFQYGHPFAQSRGIKIGEKITGLNTFDRIPDSSISNRRCRLERKMTVQPRPDKTFMGYRRNHGRCGTRNYVVVVPTSMCASAVALQIAERFPGSFPGVDAVIALPNTEGCGCAGGTQIDRFLTVLRNSILHDNVAAALVVDLGCEQTNHEVVATFLDKEDCSRALIDWLTIQKNGGAAKTVSRGVEIISSRLRQLSNSFRTPHPLSALTVGSECGASDAFSGVTANRVIGAAIDIVIASGGSAIFSEFPEMIGAEPILFPRMRNNEVKEKFLSHMKWYQEVASRLGISMNDNLVPENRAGGLINPFIKSLGAVMKGGTATIQDVVDYGERIGSKGLHLMQGPGNDLESVTGLAASGSTIICFSTGRGTVTGCALAPVIKISSTSELFAKMPDDMDFNAGALLEDRMPSYSVQELGESLLDLVIETASGSPTKPEINRQRQFQVWTAGKLSL